MKTTATRSRTRMCTGFLTATSRCSPNDSMINPSSVLLVGVHNESLQFWVSIWGVLLHLPLIFLYYLGMVLMKRVCYPCICITGGVRHIFFLLFYFFLLSYRHTTHARFSQLCLMYTFFYSFSFPERRLFGNCAGVGLSAS